MRAGRPSTAATIRTLVSQMAAANPLWGAPRIHGELVKVGVEVSEPNYLSAVCADHVARAVTDLAYFSD
jgi:hypothetical protein